MAEMLRLHDVDRFARGKKGRQMREIYRMEFSLCPYCKATNDAACDSAGSSEAPAPGDFSICAYCASVSAFTQDRGLRALTSEESLVAAHNEQVVRARAALQEIIAQRRRGAH
jgi:hypothetical protein